MAGQPITWQNINGASLSEASRPMEAATNSFNNAFTGLQGVISNSEKIDANNQIAIKGNNTQDYLNKVSELGKTPEALASAIADGSIDRLHASYGNTIDHAATRGAAEALLNTRYAQSKAATEFGHFQADEKAAPFMEDYKVAALQASQARTPEAKAAAQAVMDTKFGQYKQAGGRAGSAVEAFGIQTAEQAAERMRSQGTYDRQGVMQDATIKNQEGMLGVARQNAGTTAAGVAVQRGQLDLARTAQQGVESDRLAGRAEKLRADLSGVMSSTLGSTAGTKMAMDQINATFDKGTAAHEAAMQLYSRAVLNPNMTTEGFLAGMPAIDGRKWYAPWVTGQSTALKTATTLAGTDAAVARRDNNELAAKRIRDEMTAVSNKQKLLEAGKPGAPVSTVAPSTSVVANPLNNTDGDRPGVVKPVAGVDLIDRANAVAQANIAASGKSAPPATVAAVASSYEGMSSSEKYVAEKKMKAELFAAQRDPKKEVSPETKALYDYLNPEQTPEGKSRQVLANASMEARRRRDLHLDR